MRSVLISIRPKWCELIVTGNKTVEVRKTKPKLETPFKVYIYCTAGFGKNTLCLPVSHKRIMEHYAETGSMDSLNAPIGNGKVIGEFICDYITPVTAEHIKNIAQAACLTLPEMWEYGKRSSAYDLFGWHVSDLKIYDKPKALSKYGTKHKCNISRKCTEQGFLCAGYCKLTRPPQSWCYVEELDNA